MTKFKNKKSLKALSLKTCKLFKIKCCCKTVVTMKSLKYIKKEEWLVGLLNDTILDAEKSWKANYTPALAGEIYYASLTFAAKKV